jgi:Ser/Thr protein kinase RdoA (MazF antagonist)
LNNRVDDPNIPTSALEMMIDFDEYRHSKFAADSKVGYNAYTEAVRIL